ncbi:MAG: flavodoxin [Promethearchaeota archaeon]
MFQNHQILIAYYSHSGNTHKIAQRIKEIVGGELFRIEPVKSYPESYQEVLKVAKKEIGQNYKPPLKNKVKNIDKFDIIYIGSPNWYSTIAPPVTSFLSAHNFSGKKIIPFISHGGGGKGLCIPNLKKMVPNAIILEGIVVYGSNVKSLNIKTVKIQ